MSEKEICLAYEMGLSAIDKISDFIEKYGNKCEFNLRPTFLFSNSIFLKQKLKDEYNFRIKNGFICDYFDEINNPFPFAHSKLIHDATTPYHYFRLLPDSRIIFGGEDTLYKGDGIKEKLSEKKYKKLEKDLKNLFQDRQDIKIDYKFCGCFGATNNNMGLIGESKFDDDILLFISCGANGNFC